MTVDYSSLPITSRSLVRSLVALTHFKQTDKQKWPDELAYTAVTFMIGKSLLSSVLSFQSIHKLGHAKSKEEKQSMPTLKFAVPALMRSFQSCCVWKTGECKNS